MFFKLDWNLYRTVSGGVGLIPQTCCSPAPVDSGGNSLSRRLAETSRIIESSYSLMKNSCPMLSHCENFSKQTELKEKQSWKGPPKVLEPKQALSLPFSFIPELVSILPYLGRAKKPAVINNYQRPSTITIF